MKQRLSNPPGDFKRNTANLYFGGDHWLLLRKEHLKVLLGASLSRRFLPPSPTAAEAFICPRIECTCHHNGSLIEDHPVNIVLDEVQAGQAGFRSPVRRLGTHQSLMSAWILRARSAPPVLNQQLPWRGMGFKIEEGLWYRVL